MIDHDDRTGKRPWKTPALHGEEVADASKLPNPFMQAPSIRKPDKPYFKTIQDKRDNKLTNPK